MRRLHPCPRTPAVSPCRAGVVVAVTGWGKALPAAGVGGSVGGPLRASGRMRRWSAVATVPAPGPTCGTTPSQQDGPDHTGRRWPATFGATEPADRRAAAHVRRAPSRRGGTGRTARRSTARRTPRRSPRRSPAPARRSRRTASASPNVRACRRFDQPGHEHRHDRRRHDRRRHDRETAPRGPSGGRLSPGDGRWWGSCVQTIAAQGGSGSASAQLWTTGALVDNWPAETLGGPGP